MSDWTNWIEINPASGKSAPDVSVKVKPYSGRWFFQISLTKRLQADLDFAKKGNWVSLFYHLEDGQAKIMIRKAEEGFAVQPFTYRDIIRFASPDGLASARLEAQACDYEIGDDFLVLTLPPAFLAENTPDQPVPENLRRVIKKASVRVGGDVLYGPQGETKLGQMAEGVMRYVLKAKAPDLAGAHLARFGERAGEHDMIVTQRWLPTLNDALLHRVGIALRVTEDGKIYLVETALQVA